MKRLLLGVVAVGLVVAAVALSGNQNNGTSGDMQVAVEDRNPWTHLRVNGDPSEFRFAVVSDRTGGHREKVFSRAIDQLNLMQPDFVVSVGDLIEGYTKDEAKMAAEWREFQSYVHRLQMPFFYVPGNHDLANLEMAAYWKQKFGRSYYHFVYRNVLFLCLNSDDPPVKEGNTGQLSPEQIAYVKKALDENRSVRWTFVMLHKPVWAMQLVDKSGWPEVESLLAGRNYTVFAGHVHRFQKFVRNGQRYYQLATTGGGSKMRGVKHGEFDHICWVTMRKDGPVLANILLDGVYAEDMSRPFSEEAGVPITNRLPLHPVRGKVHFEGSPTPDAMISFFRMVDDKKAVKVSDAFIEADGSYVLSTHNAFDGTPAGDYLVTIVWHNPPTDREGKPGVNLLPERYSKPATTPLKATVKTGQNEFTFDLKK